MVVTNTTSFKVSVSVVTAVKNETIILKGVAGSGFVRLRLCHVNDGQRTHSKFSMTLFAPFWRFIVGSLLHYFQGPYFDRMEVTFNNTQRKVFGIDNGDFSLEDVATDDQVEACFDAMKEEFRTICGDIERMIQ